MAGKNWKDQAELWFLQESPGSKACSPPVVTEVQTIQKSRTERGYYSGRTMAGLA